MGPVCMSTKQETWYYLLCRREGHGSAGAVPVTRRAVSAGAEAEGEDRYSIAGEHPADLGRLWAEGVGSGTNKTVTSS